MDESAAILVIGNEILSGKVVDTNSPYLVKELTALGLPVRRILTIPDEVPAIGTAVREFSSAYDHVLTCGGVGPTLDDVTLDGVAAAFGLPLEDDPVLVGAIRNHFGPSTLESHLKMARVPKGASLVPLPGLAWAAVFVRNVLILPGDPVFLRRKFEALKERFRRTPFIVRRLFTWIEEGALAPALDELHRSHPRVRIGSYPVYGNPDYSVQVTLEAKDGAAVEAALVHLAAALDPRMIVRVE
jgi:molybdenum cofactor synthesis domain-containing protein